MGCLSDEERGLKNLASKIIVDYVLLYVHISKHILEYFKTVLDVLKRYHTTIKHKQ